MNNNSLTNLKSSVVSRSSLRYSQSSFNLLVSRNNEIKKRNEEKIEFYKKQHQVKAEEEEEIITSTTKEGETDYESFVDDNIVDLYYPTRNRRSISVSSICSRNPSEETKKTKISGIIDTFKNFWKYSVKSRINSLSHHSQSRISSTNTVHHLNFPYFPKANPITVTTLREFNEKYAKPIEADDAVELKNFTLFRTIGRGSFGRVILSLKRQAKIFYAVKILKKATLIETNQVEHIINEKKILYACDHPNIIKFKYCFKDTTNVYFVFDFYSNGDLYGLLNQRKYFSEDEARFYAANVFLALEYLHLNNIVYRDLKPENILVTTEGYLKLTDFGFAKRINGKTNTCCGTPDYMAPEIIEHKSYGKSVDWWCFGIFCYELCSGKPPFIGRNSGSLYDLILENKYDIPDHFSSVLKDLIKGLIKTNYKKRLGCLSNKSGDICEHEWFRYTNWEAIYAQEEQAPYVPNCKSALDVVLNEETKRAEDKIQLYRQAQYEIEFNEF